MKKTFLLFTAFILLSISANSQQYKFTNDKVSIKFTEFKVIGEQLHCEFQISALTSDETINIFLNSTKMIDMEGNEYFPEYAEIGNKEVTGRYGVLGQDLIAGVHLKGKFVFFGTVSKRKVLNFFEIPIKLPKLNLTYNARFRNITIPYGKSALNKNLKSKFYKEIDDETYVELKSSIKDENTLTFNFLLTNFDDDKNQILSANSCKCVDDLGNEYIVSKISFGSDIKDGRYANIGKQCVKDIPIKLSIIFKDDKIPDIKEIKLLELAMNKNKTQFKNLTLQ